MKCDANESSLSGGRVVPPDREAPPGREVMRDVIQLGIDARCDSAEPDIDFNAILA